MGYLNARLLSALGFDRTTVEYMRQVSNELVWTNSGDVVDSFNYDGTNYQPQRTDAKKYTYDTGGTYQYENGGGGSGALYPWIDREVHFYKGNVLQKTFSFRHLQNYGLESSSARVSAAKARSVWRTSSGSAADGDFTVTIAGNSASKWDGTLYNSTHEVYTTAMWDGSENSYVIVITHTASGSTLNIVVLNTGIVAVGPIDGGSFGK